MKGVYIFLAEGFEDVEALGTADVLRRGAVDVKLVSTDDSPFVVSSHGVAVGVDCTIEDIDIESEGTTEKDVMIFPGGMPGTKNLAANEDLMDVMKEHYDCGGTVAAICAAPGLVLSQLGESVLKGAEVTCFDGFETYLEACGAKFIPRPAIRSGRIISGRSAGHALSFGLEILKLIKGEKVAEEVRKSLMLTTI